MKGSHALIVFDFDGTLVDTAPGIHEGANGVLRTLGYPGRSLDEVKKAIGRGVQELFRDLMVPAEPEGIEKAVDLFREWYRENPVLKTKVYPGVVPVLSGPLSGMKKTIVTNKPDDLVKVILEKLGMVGFFDIVVGTGAGFPPKPDPGSVLFVLQRTHVSPARTILIGDSSIDWETARRAGTAFGWVSYGYEPLSPNGSCPVFSSPKEWEKVLHADL